IEEAESANPDLEERDGGHPTVWWVTERKTKDSRVLTRDTTLPLAPQRTSSPGTPMLAPQRTSSPGTPMLAPQRTSSPGTPMLAPQRTSSPGTPMRFEGGAPGCQAAALAAAVRTLAVATDAETGVAVYSEAFQSPRQRLSRPAAQRSPQRTITLSFKARFASQGMNFTS